MDRQEGLSAVFLREVEPKSAISVFQTPNGVSLLRVNEPFVATHGMTQIRSIVSAQGIASVVNRNECHLGWTRSLATRHRRSKTQRPCFVDSENKCNHFEKCAQGVSPSTRFKASPNVHHARCHCCPQRDSSKVILSLRLRSQVCDCISHCVWTSPFKTFKKLHIYGSVSV